MRKRTYLRRFHGMVYLLRRTPAYTPLLTISSLALAPLSISWMTERILELDLGTNTLVDTVIQTPQAFMLAGLLTAVAAASAASNQNIRTCTMLSRGTFTS